MKRLVDDELWAAIEPLLPKHPPQPKGGRPFVDDRAALAGILFVLKSGIPWSMLPTELGCGSGVTCWRRLRDWQAAGVWAQLHQVLLERLAQSHRLDWSRASADARSVAAKRGALRRDPIRSTARARARSTTSSSTPPASRSPRC